MFDAFLKEVLCALELEDLAEVHSSSSPGYKEFEGRSTAAN